MSDAVIENLRAEVNFYRDGIEVAIKALDSDSPVGKKLSRVLALARYQPVPCRRCGRMLRSRNSIKAGFGATCHKLYASEAQDNFSLKGDYEKSKETP
jgi:hypothetical protein